MSHFRSVFNNSCVKVPVDPSSKMPITEYERKAKRIQKRTNKSKRCSIDSNSSDCSLLKADMDAKQVREFYQSIPDYKDINHLTQDEFYSTLRSLREKKRQMLGYSVTHIDDDNGQLLSERPNITEECVKQIKSRLNTSKPRYDKDEGIGGIEYSSNIKKITDDIECILKDANAIPNDPIKTRKTSPPSDCELELKRIPIARELSPKTVVNVDNPREPTIRSESRTKRNHSACSISWNDQCAGNVHDDVDSRFDKYFGGAQLSTTGKERKSRSMPTSPVKVRRTLSPDVYRKNALTVPKPFKMTLRDDDERTCNELRCLSKSFSDEMLHRKSERRRFRARPVPLQSRIPLYDKIMEDQAMRRAISKLNSTAELEAQMKPFSFTEREEQRPRHTCDRHDPAAAAAATLADPLPRVRPGDKKKKFKARPIPKNLFSSNIYEKMREDEFYRALNRRIRAEELLRNASLPPSMAARDKPGCRSRMSTPGGLLSDLPTDTTSELSSNKSGKRRKTKRSSKSGKRAGEVGDALREFVTTSPQPFHFRTASRAQRKDDDETKKIYGKRNSSPSGRPARSVSAGGGGGARPLSALDVPSVNRTNLAAVLRIESTKKRLEEEVEQRLAEQEYRAELRWRDHVLRKKPAWQLVRNNYEEDIAMRLQTRRDEERLRREEFLHEMELMYGRVRNQPLLFERYYSPSKSRRDIVEAVSREMEIPLKDTQRRKNGRASKSAPPRQTIPSHSRKVSINETVETMKGDLADYLYRLENEEKLFSGTDSLSDVTSNKNDC